MIFFENRLQSDNSHEISYLIFSKIGKDVENVSPAAVVIAALMVNIHYKPKHMIPRFTHKAPPIIRSRRQFQMLLLFQK